MAGEQPFTVRVYQSLLLVGTTRENVWNIVGNYFDLGWSKTVHSTIQVNAKTRRVNATAERFVVEDLLDYHHDDTSKPGLSYYTYNMHPAEDMNTFAFAFPLQDYKANVRVMDLPGNNVAVTLDATCRVESAEAQARTQGDVDGLFKSFIANLEATFKQ